MDKDIEPTAAPLEKDEAQLDLTLEARAGERLDVLLEPDDPSKQDAGQLPDLEDSPAPLWGGLKTRSQQLSLSRLRASEKGFFIFALLIYLFVVLIRLPDFPIYFFCDEAAQTIRAENLVNNYGKDEFGDFLPTFFANDHKFSLSASVYLQVPPYLLFDKSVWTARGIAALMTLLAAYWVGRILRDFFHTPFWWCGPLLLIAAPAWFLFSRTAFECSLMVTFYAGFLYYYLRYRNQEPRALYLAILCAAISFYSYTPGELVVLASGAMLALIDIRYHWQQRHTVGLGLLLLLVLALPFIRFNLAHPEEYSSRMVMYGSVWAQDISFGEKLSSYLNNYLLGLNPLYWFLPNGQDFPIYTMKGYGHLPWWMLPLMVAGMVVVIKRQRPFRAYPLLVAIIAAPLGGAMVQVQVSRALEFVIPAVIFAALGLTALLTWLQQRFRLTYTRMAYALFALLAAVNLLMLNDALTNGPLWYRNYGMDGMQYGAQQIFSAARDYLKSHPDKKIFVSPNWAFRTEEMLAFFLPPSLPVRIGALDYAFEQLEPQLETYVFVLMEKELEAARTSGVFSEITIDQTLYYPDGTPGFYFTRLKYRPDILDYMQSVKEERFLLVEESITLDGQTVIVRHSRLDTGGIALLFDGNPESPIRSDGVNPLVVELEFPSPMALSGIELTVGSEDKTITITLKDEAGQVLDTLVQEETASNGIHTLAFPFAQKMTVKTLRVELLDKFAPDVSIVHMWELTLIR